MKALTLTQPWATLVAIGAKGIETRSWSTPYRGPLAIHAAKGFPADARYVCHDEPFRGTLRDAGITLFSQLPIGEIIATCELADIWRFDEGTRALVEYFIGKQQLPPHELAFGDFSAGRDGLLLKDVRRLETPIPCRGMLGLWEVPPAIAEQLEHARAA